MSTTRKIMIAGAFLILIIGMFLVPRGSNGPGKSAKWRMTKTMMAGLTIATGGYQTEYLRLPIIPNSDSTFIESRGSLIAALLAEADTNNPRKIKFFDPPLSKNGRGGAAKNAANEWELRDPWGNFYRILLDVDGDGKIPNPARATSEDESETISNNILIYSAGPDGDFSTWKDNIRSWE